MQFTLEFTQSSKLFLTESKGDNITYESEKNHAVNLDSLNCHL